MGISKKAFASDVRDFNFKNLFNELGWDNAKVKYPIKIDDVIFTVTAVAEKKQFLIFVCSSEDSDNIPDSEARKKIDNAISKLHYEHLIVYVDRKCTRQRWEVVIREPNKPIVCRPVDYYAGQDPELLFQKLEGLFFTFEDEEKLSIVDVRSRVVANFEKNAEVVTKKFYDQFSKEHKKFLGFINGIENIVDKEWYASLMLNRLMFIYFIQKKGFLDNDRDYLRGKLGLVRQKRGKNKFYSFYRDFLLVLFHKGLGSPAHDKDFEEEFGEIPYLNGGLFDVHEIENNNRKITIEDKAFERIFDFFDEYNWHLDTRVTASGKDVNPDVIGYIFEKYINDRAAMGAYYTKEDITEYISRNCILPWIFDEVKRHYAAAFTKEGFVWKTLRESGDRYIHQPMKHGVIPNVSEEDAFDDLPQVVKDGLNPSAMDLVEKRKSWNRVAPEEIALPTEIYRDVISRRKRFYETLKQIEDGKITDVNDLVTFNLDIRQFAQDVVSFSDDPQLIAEFYKAVRKITVLDPTCGSGAFLFAALNVLEPIYFACLTGMRRFTDNGKRGKNRFFEEQLALVDADAHPSEEYFIYKSIILNNLYGVDIMKEAVEIAKLRLFLKLVATVDVDYSKANLGLEPLPDIDFNIRSGNSLVGFTTLDDLTEDGQSGLFGDEEEKAIVEQANVVSNVYGRFKDMQLVMHSDPTRYKGAKDELNRRLVVLNARLNKHFAVSYLGPTHTKPAFEKWVSSHQPFHWVAEYYTTMAQGGFDVIIGNPPYVEYAKVRNTYEPKGLVTTPSGNLYGMIVEVALKLLKPSSRLGVIVPMSLVSTPRMQLVRNLVVEGSEVVYLSHYSGNRNPSVLFDGVEMRLTICLAQKESVKNGKNSAATFSTEFRRWGSDARGHLFDTTRYAEVQEGFRERWLFPKFGSEREELIISKLERVSGKSVLGLATTSSGPSKVYAHRIASYFVKALNFIPHFSNERDGKKRSEDYKVFAFSKKNYATSACCLLNSNLFYMYYILFSDAYHCGRELIERFPIDIPSISKDLSAELRRIEEALMKDLEKHSDKRTIGYKNTGSVEMQKFFPKLSKPIIDEIDTVFAKHYGFTNEELDFIINYDIKYRLGKELDVEAED